MTVLILLLGEVLPKQAARKNADKLALFFAVPLQFIIVITFPVTFAVNKLVALISRLWGGKGGPNEVTPEELVTMIETVEDEGVIGEYRSELLQSVIDFGSVETREIMTPRVNMTAFDAETSVSDLLSVAEKSGNSRFPVYEDTEDHIIGILSLDRLYKEMAAAPDVDLNIRTLLEKPFFVYGTKLLPDLLGELRENRVTIAVVVDEYGQTAGLVTQEDVMEQVVGEIWDESDVAREDFKQIDGETFDVDGGVSLRDFFDYLDIKDAALIESASESVTVGGWAVERLGDFPKVGQSFAAGRLSVTVTEMDEMRVAKLRVRTSAG
jgi:CBS domain containing-hemolysin-like protein